MVSTWRIPTLRLHHTLTGPNTSIKLLPEGADTSLAHAAHTTTVDADTHRKIEEQLAQQPSPESIPICCLCKANTRWHTITYYWLQYTENTRRHLALPESPEGIVYHMRGRQA
ncbi:hypothetical protein C8Q77DRAFT_141957 [Trametes polyzona]|nr:hypothetical protein C8Q77DRAFT_141957 [Trametes polyzona]